MKVWYKIFSVKSYLTEKEIFKGKISEMFRGDHIKKWIPDKQSISKLPPCNRSTQQLRVSICQSLAKAAYLVWKWLLILTVHALWNKVRSPDEYKRQKMIPDSSYSARLKPAVLMAKSNLTRSPGSLLPKCGPRTSSKHITRERFKSAESQAKPRFSETESVF